MSPRAVGTDACRARSQPRSIIALGDELQNLNGLSPHHGSFIRQRCIDHSLRAGPAMDNVLNPLIQAHPAAIQAAFSGSAEHYTRSVSSIR
jgi:hypothetical protein